MLNNFTVDQCFPFILGRGITSGAKLLLRYLDLQKKKEKGKASNVGINCIVCMLS